MLKQKLLEDSYQALWFKQVLDHLKTKSLTDDDVKRIISDVIGEYVVHEITLSQLLIVAIALKKNVARLSADTKYIIEDFSAIEDYKEDREYIHNILIDVLRKISNV